ncbi:MULTISPECIES: hypothetical protein [Bradyrhizobium]|uniref:Uncharacterized protein n=1 Tax=Bradyrhizobium brasilense TaxID=1419277 RepID=A0ABY8J8J8_9BRAD|nr:MULTISPECIES: hypothetical protein [Bradyrhizobium]MCP1833755.1 hypothetical protein [Bradyrhizobium sp. USDA 4545]MCP1918499.1 hypothetical protein [Bradyrhizobium sp. USDA 4532]WFU60971.1 hypothetical protein QA636_25920 [Bradyrhizobium brasilense]
MQKKPESSELSEEQLGQVAATLKRIREGLDCADRLVGSEPSHYFTPGIQETMQL